MSGKKNLYKLLSLVMGLGNLSNEELQYLDMPFNEKLMSYSVTLVMEIDGLIEDGYSYDEIKNFIKTCDFKKNDKELTDEEEKYLRMDAYRILKIRYNIYEEEKEEQRVKEKTKKHLF